jgi:hypothetical protein
MSLIRDKQDYRLFSQGFVRSAPILLIGPLQVSFVDNMPARRNERGNTTPHHRSKRVTQASHH